MNYRLVNVGETLQPTDEVRQNGNWYTLCEHTFKHNPNPIVNLYNDTSTPFPYGYYRRPIKDNLTDILTDMLTLKSDINESINIIDNLILKLNQQ